jgi:hypothetical protein
MSNRWKQYSGTNHLDNTRIGTLIADNIIVKNAYNGDFTVNGNIIVGNVNAYSISISNVLIDNDVITNGNLTVKNTSTFSGTV